MKGEEGNLILSILKLHFNRIYVKAYDIIFAEPMVTMMEVSNTVAVQNSDTRRLTINGGSDMEAEISLTVIPQSDDDDDGGLSSDCSNQSHDNFSGNSADLMAAAMGDDVTAQLAAAGWQKTHLHGLCSLFCFFNFYLRSFTTKSLPSILISNETDFFGHRCEVKYFLKMKF